MSIAPPLPPPSVEVLGCGADETLAVLVGQRKAEERAAVEQLKAVCHYADLHRVDHVGAVDADISRDLSRRGPRTADSHLGVEAELRLAGEGAFFIDEFAVAEVAAALCLSEPAARAYVGRSLELRDRLPRLWHRVVAGELPAWKALKVAEQTIPLNAEAAEHVDRQVAPFAHQLSLGRVLKAVEAAVLRHDPERAAEQAKLAADRRGVWVEDRVDGTSALTAITSTPDAAAFDAALNQVANTLGALGDEATRDVRRAKAVGVLADPQYALDLLAADDEQGSATSSSARRDGAVLHVHLHTDAVAGIAPVGRVDGCGARSLAGVEQWLAELAPGVTVKVTPVVDLTEEIAVDAYEAPDRLRQQVEHRDHRCVFPWCGQRGRFDLDHIEEYVPLDEGGPPGQTSTQNLARLCRFHHRVKTHRGRHGRWDYDRDPTGALIWTSPLGRRYAVDGNGTALLP